MEVDSTETGRRLGKLLLRTELAVTSQFVQNLTALHLGQTFQAVGEGLRGKTFLKDATNGFVDVEKIARNEHRVGGQEIKKRHFPLLSVCQLGHDLRLFAAFLRQLILNFKRADGVDFVAKEVDAERQFVAVAVDIEYRTANGKLTRFIDIVGLLKSVVTQLLFQLNDVGGLPHAQRQERCIQCLLRHHQFCQRLRIGDY